MCPATKAVSEMSRNADDAGAAERTWLPAAVIITMAKLLYSIYAYYEKKYK
jgi:hypothetical protein